jgi:ethanolamine utilization protein EutQ (cupin superfamily)
LRETITEKGRNKMFFEKGQHFENGNDEIIVITEIIHLTNEVRFADGVFETKMKTADFEDMLEIDEFELI